MKQKHTNMQTTQLIDWSPEDNKSDSGMTAVDTLYQQLNALPKDDQEELMIRMGAQRGKFFRGLIHAAWIRRMGSDRMYFSIQKSMQLCLFIHLSQKRAETIALLDSGATENFINMQYAKELRLPIKCLQ